MATTGVPERTDDPIVNQSHINSSKQISPEASESRLPAGGLSLRFSLRTLLLLTVVASILSTVVGLPYAEYRRELLIARKLEAQGGSVDWRPRTESWGADFFSRRGLSRVYLRVNGVEFKNGWRTKNDDLSGLSDLKHLKWLSFSDSSVDDSGLIHFSDCNSLTYLEMKNNRSITDAGLRKLNLNNLNTLHIDGTDIGYDGIKWIAKQNPKLDGQALLARHVLAQLEIADFNAQKSTDPRQLPRVERLIVRPNSKQQWSEAAEHLRAFPGPVIVPFYDRLIGNPQHPWGLALSVVLLDGTTEITSRDLSTMAWRHSLSTLSAIAIVPPREHVVSRLVGKGTIRAWFGTPEWPPKIGIDHLDIPGTAEIVYVDATSLPVKVELQPIR